MDVACFIGFVSTRKLAPPAKEIADWLDRHRWLQRAESEDWALLDVPVPIESWESFDQMFAWEQRLDSSIVISSDALTETISISEDNQLFKIVVNGNEQELTLAIGDYSPEAVASLLNDNLIDVDVSAESIHEEIFLRFEHSNSDAKGHVTIFTHPALGFSRAISRANDYLHSYLGAAVRAFFAQGGRKCYVIRMGNPLPLMSHEIQRVQQLGELLTGASSLWSDATQVKHLVNAYIPQITLSQERPEEWHGVDHLLGLTDISYLSLPDLAELLAHTPLPASHATLPLQDELFVECAPTLTAARNHQSVAFLAPHCDENGYLVWSRIIQRLIRFIRSMSREVHLVASLPLASDDINREFKSYVLDKWFSASGDTSTGAAEQDIRSAFLQLCYPWLKSSESDLLPGQALPPEGVLTGMLAANALSRGVFNSVAGKGVLHAYDLFPDDFFTPSDERLDHYADFYAHISVFARAPGAIQLISDVTASDDESYRPAVVSRLMALIVRAARHQGRSTLFEPMSHASWRAVEKSLSTLLISIFNAGGLRGRNPDDAFSVQCNESTMTKNDIDNGRLIANVSFQPAIPIHRIHLALSLEQGGQVILQGAA